MGYPIDCNEAYSFETVNELKGYYDYTAQGYDRFLDETNYILHKKVAEIVGAQWADIVGSVLDVGSGTGKLGIEISKIKPKVVIDGIDFSESMTERADKLKIYNELFNLNIKGDLSSVTNRYDLLVSSGAFSPNHLNADDLINLLSLLNNGGRVFISVKKNLFEEDNFESKLEALVGQEEIRNLMYTEVRIWGSPDYTDTAIVVNFQKA
jgi:predicted TPR repeat methyltransferase